MTAPPPPYPHLLSPLRIGPVPVANRVVFAAHLTNYAEDGRPTRQHAAYYGARARGGAGLIITEEQSTHPTDRPYEKMIAGYRPDVVAGYRRITGAVHRHGSVVFAQINHNGPQGSGLYSRLPLWGPSPVPDPTFREVPHAVGADEIEELLAGYVTVARHCAEGGFDGVELQCSQSSILRCFLSPRTNRRSDGYGGPLLHRARLLLETIAAVREAIGPDLALGVRLGGDDLETGGTNLDDAVAVARMVEHQGRTDYLNTTIGVATSSLWMVEPSMRVPPGYALRIPSAVRRAVALPVVAVGRFKDPQQAERAIGAGHCDLVGIVRGQIADPDFVAKAKEGRAGDIRACPACNQECVGRMGRNRWLGCVENPAAGREALREAGHGTEPGADRTPHPTGRAGPTLGPPGRTGRTLRRLVVIGAGPGGLQAAVTAAGAGHAVTVFERAPAPGGQIRLAAQGPGRGELADITDNLARAAIALGVDLRLGVTAGAADVLTLGPDVIVVATGADPRRPAWAPADDTRVVDVAEVLDGTVAPIGTVVVVDGIGSHHAPSVAELLAGRGARVTVTTDAMAVGQELDTTLDLEHWRRLCVRLGITERTDLVPMHLTAAGLSMLHHPTGTAREVPADWIVVAVPRRPADGLYRQLRARPAPQVHRIGDCVAPRRAHAAIIEGDRIGRAI
jgi:mycofactocin system FadH/OYE family oxidoreductase 2